MRVVGGRLCRVFGNDVVVGESADGVYCNGMVSQHQPSVWLKALCQINPCFEGMPNVARTSCRPPHAASSRPRKLSYTTLDPSAAHRLPDAEQSIRIPVFTAGDRLGPGLTASCCTSTAIALSDRAPDPEHGDDPQPIIDRAGIRAADPEDEVPRCSCRSALRRRYNAVLAVFTANVVQRRAAPVPPLILSQGETSHAVLLNGYMCKRYAIVPLHRKLRLQRYELRLQRYDYRYGG